MLLPTARQLFVPQELPDYVDFPRMIRNFGYLPTALCLVGTFVLAFKSGKKNYGLVLGLLLLLVMLVTFFSLRYGISIVYADQECSNPSLVKVHRWIYLLEEP